MHQRQSSIWPLLKPTRWPFFVIFSLGSSKAKKARSPFPRRRYKFAIPKLHASVRKFSRPNHTHGIIKLQRTAHISWKIDSVLFSGVPISGPLLSIRHFYASERWKLPQNYRWQQPASQRKIFASIWKFAWKLNDKSLRPLNACTHTWTPHRFVRVMMRWVKTRVGQWPPAVLRSAPLAHHISLFSTSEWRGRESRSTPRNSCKNGNRFSFQRFPLFSRYTKTTSD